MLGLGSVAQVVTGQGAFGEYLSINLGFGLGVAMGVHVGGKVSGMRADNFKPHNPIITDHCHLTCFSCFVTLPGAHMNAAVSLTMCVFGRLAWKMLPLYVFAQLLGSFLAAGTIYAVYYGEALQVLDLYSLFPFIIVTFLLAAIYLSLSFATSCRGHT